MYLKFHSCKAWFATQIQENRKVSATGVRDSDAEELWAPDLSCRLQTTFLISWPWPHMKSIEQLEHVGDLDVFVTSTYFNILRHTSTYFYCSLTATLQCLKLFAAHV